MERSSREPLPAGAADGGHGGRRCRGGGTAAGGRAEHHDDVVALDAGVVGHHLVKVQHQARAVLGLGGQDRVQTRGVHVDAPRGQRKGGVRQVQRDARRVVDGEGQRLRGGPRQAHGQLQLLSGQRLHIDGLQPLQAIDVQPLAGQQLQLTLRLSGPAPQPLAFTIDNPARISIDLPSTDAGAALAAHRRARLGGLDTILAAEAKDRTRLVLNLDKMCRTTRASTATTSS